MKDHRSILRISVAILVFLLENGGKVTFLAYERSEKLVWKKEEKNYGSGFRRQNDFGSGWSRVRDIG